MATQVGSWKKLLIIAVMPPTHSGAGQMVISGL